MEGKGQGRSEDTLGLPLLITKPGDDEEPEDEFEDWIDQVNGFLHYLAPLPLQIDSISAAPPILCYTYV